MTRTFLVAALGAALIAAVTIAHADSLLLLGVGPGGAGGGGSCSNSLDFSAACNSANIPLIAF